MVMEYRTAIRVRHSQIEAYDFSYTRIPGFSKGFILHTDASDFRVALLCQSKLSVGSRSSTETVIAYTSRHLIDREQKWSAIEKELYAIVHAVKTFHSYLYGQEIVVLSDHKPLEFLMSKSNLSGRLGRWSLLLQQYDLIIHYRPGKANQNADTLSRIPFQCASIGINMITTADLPTDLEIAAAQQEDAYCITLRGQTRRAIAYKQINHNTIVFCYEITR